MPANAELAGLYRRDLRRLTQELEAFPSQESLWGRLPGIANCAGHLFLHLEGNQREYIGRQLGGVAYRRERDLEFSLPPISKADLMARIAPLVELIPGIVQALPLEVLDAPYPEEVNGQVISTRQFLIHLIGHLNYHLGQIDYLRRVLTGDSAVEFVRA